MTNALQLSTALANASQAAARLREIGSKLKSANGEGLRFARAQILVEQIEKIAMENPGAFSQITKSALIEEVQESGKRLLKKEAELISFNRALGNVEEYLAATFFLAHGSQGPKRLSDEVESIRGFVASGKEGMAVAFAVQLSLELGRLSSPENMGEKPLADILQKLISNHKNENARHILAENALGMAKEKQLGLRTELEGAVKSMGETFNAYAESIMSNFRNGLHSTGGF